MTGMYRQSTAVVGDGKPVSSGRVFDGGVPDPEKIEEGSLLAVSVPADTPVWSETSDEPVDSADTPLGDSAGLRVWHPRSSNKNSSADAKG
jgi:hypothetical protein